MKKALTVIFIIIVAAMLILTLSPGLFSAAAPRALAHVAGEGAGDAPVEATILEPDLFAAKTETPVFFTVREKTSGALIPDLDPIVAIEDSAGKAIAEFGTEEKGENYFFSYTFPESGNYAIHVEFPYRGEKLDFAFPIFASEPEGESRIPAAIALAALLLVGAALALGVKRKRLKPAIISSLLIIILAVLGYSLYKTFESGAAGSGVVTCVDDETCFWTAHIHAYAPIAICGEDFRLPIEVGRLDGPHTHEEKNIAHWHDKLPYDRGTKTIADTESLTAGAFFDAIEIPFDRDRIGSRRNGDLCPDGTPGTVKMFVNGTRSDEFRSYLWRDRDVIQIFFDRRTSEEIEAEIRERPVKFPALGRG